MLTIAQRAIQLAHTANEDEALKKVFHSGVENAEKNKQSVHHVYLRMLTSPKLGKEKLNETPVPGSKEGNNPDHFEGVNELTAKKENGTYTNVFADNLDEGTTIRTAIRNLAESKDMADPEKERHVRRWNSRLTTLRSLVRRSLLAHHKIATIQHKFPSVGISFAMVETKDKETGAMVEGYDMSTTAPFCLVDKKPNDSSKPQAYRYLSYGEFLSLKLDVAEKNKASMGEWKALVNSGKKGKKKGKAAQDVAGALVAHITTVDKFTDYAAEMVAYLKGTGGDDGKGYSRIMNRLASLPKGDDRKRFVILLGSLCMELDGIWTDIGGEFNVYQKEQNAINAGENKAAA